ncbi:hypothetical protein [Natronospora cellulosivora (SeqCode)]
MKKVLMVLLVAMLALSLGVSTLAGPSDDAIVLEDFSSENNESVWGNWSPFHASFRITDEEEYTKDSDRSLVITKASEYRQSNASLHNTHENWDLLIENNTIGFWLYVEDYDNIYENEWAVFLAPHDQDGEWMGSILNVRQSELEPGWNWVETWIDSIYGDVGSLMFGFNHYAPEDEDGNIDMDNVFTSVYIDSIYVW